MQTHSPLRFPVSTFSFNLVAFAGREKTGWLRDGAGGCGVSRRLASRNHKPLSLACAMPPRRFATFSKPLPFRAQAAR